VTAAISENLHKEERSPAFDAPAKPMPAPAQEEVAVYQEESPVPPAATPSAAEPIHPHTTGRSLTLEEMNEAALPSFRMNTGNIIRETKRERFKLLPSMVTATKTWAQDLSESYTARRHPRHEVMQAEVRKHTIEAASKEAENAPKDDFSIVVERLKNAPRQKVTTGITFSKKKEMPAPQWTYVQDEASPVEETSSKPAPIPAEEEPTDTEGETAFEAVSIPEEGREGTPLPSQTEYVPVSAEGEPPQFQKEGMDVTDVVSGEKAEELPHYVPFEARQPILEEEAAYQQSVPAPHEPERSSERERTFPVLFFGSVVGVAVLLGIGVSLALFLQRPQSSGIVEQPAATEPPHLLQAQEVKGIPLPATHDQLLSAVGAENAGGNTVSMYYFTTRSGAIAGAADVLSVLAAQTDGSFSRNVTDLAFGRVGGEPYLLLKTKDFDTAFAGVLGWERTLSGDLAPLFGEPVVSSFDPTARTDTQLREAFFKDEIVSNKNARVLLDEKGNERIVYAFTDRNTLIITTTPDAFATLVPLVR
jgi:hypothetical protein